MTVAVEQEKEMAEYGQEGKTITPSDYGCQILLEKTTLEAANDKSFPNDARLIWYVVDGVEYIDLTRCSKVVKLFDMYYDRYGKGAVQKIDFGYGTVNPKLWGNKPKKEKKMNDEDLREQINSLIRDEIQENINDYVDSVEETKKAGLGFVSADDDKELKVKVSQREIDKIIKEYKKMKRSEKSNLSQIKKLGLVDKNGKPLS